MSRRSKIAVIVTVAAAVAAVLIFVVIPALRDKVLDISVDRNTFPVKGIDISHHNGDIDFEKVKNDTVDFVIIKASDGIGHTDPRMSEYYNKARKARLDIGVYHFFRYNRNGRDQARYFMSVIDTLALDLPVAIDLEDTDNEEGHEDYVSGRLRDMVDELHRAGYRVMIYANHKQYESYIDGRFDDVDIWMASSRQPKPGDVRDLWQHSHVGHVDGIEGDVDLNTFNGNRDQYRAWSRPGELRNN